MMIIIQNSSHYKCNIIQSKEGTVVHIVSHRCDTINVYVHVYGAINPLIQTRGVCARRNLQVHKRLGNKPETLRAFPPSDCDVDVQNVKLCSSRERALGVLWSLKSDSFTCNYTISTEPWTRRTMLSAITSLNDSIDLMEICTVADSSTSDSRACSYLRYIDKPNNAQVVPGIMNSDVIENSFSSQRQR